MLSIRQEPSQQHIHVEDHDVACGHAHPDWVQGRHHGCDDSIMLTDLVGDPQQNLAGVDVKGMNAVVSIPGSEDDPAQVSTPDDILGWRGRQLTNESILFFVSAD